MNDYELKAEWRGETYVLIFQDTSDTDATFSGIFRILDRAKANTSWAKGAITLTNLRTNEIINQMKEKD